ncbi:MAG: hypothetical protein J3Q66DRAFT_364769 [Benniella sp.]|nr:MAG: hypothetical protein J3Q66DRAFT_364769 [Benniella sp.]
MLLLDDQLSTHDAATEHGFYTVRSCAHKSTYVMSVMSAEKSLASPPIATPGPQSWKQPVPHGIRNPRDSAREARTHNSLISLSPINTPLIKGAHSSSFSLAAMLLNLHTVFTSKESSGWTAMFAYGL